jgi:hypothetical protein
MGRPSVAAMQQKPDRTGLFERAAKSELANPQQRAMFQSLRDLWTNLANQSPFMSALQAV